MSELKIVLGQESAELHANGATYKLAPLTLSDIGECEDQFKCELSKIAEQLTSLKNILYVLYLSMRRSNPTLTPKTVGDLFKIKDVARLGEVVQAVMKISGLIDENAEEKNVAGANAAKE